jgi:hypothetical protein
VLAESCDRSSGLAALCWQIQSQRPPDIFMPVFAATCAGPRHWRLRWTDTRPGQQRRHHCQPSASQPKG